MRVEGKRSTEHDDRGHKRWRQEASDMASEVSGSDPAAVRDYVCDDLPSVTSVDVDCGCLFYARCCLEDGFDFPKFDANAIEFDLAIRSSQVFKAAIGGDSG